MASEPQPAASALPVLRVAERRVLGVLVEKAKTTPDTYPLSLNALTTGCNQKSNREPLLNLTDTDVEDTLLELQKKELVSKITGGRVERWRHELYEAWKVDKVELAVLAELLLRGGQTEGELRGRASRMEPIDDLEKLREVLRPLVERGLVVYLTAEGRRGTMLTHGFLSPKELEVQRAVAGATTEPAAASPTRAAAEVEPHAAGWEAPLAQAQAEIAALRQLVADLQTTVAGLSQEVRAFRESLGG